jgi:hypothetical protein
MRRTTSLSLAAAGLAVLVFAGAVAAVGPHATNSAGTATGGGYGGGRGGGYGTGTPVTNPVVALTADQAAHLQAMAEDEKLAMDLYTTFAAQYGDVTFSSIATSEARHLSQVRTLLARYSVTDPTAGLAAGIFATKEIQDLYGQLLSDGSASLQAAWDAGRTVEVTDIADLDAALADGNLPWDVSRVYSNLRAGSEHHLASFDAVLGA